MIFFKNKKNILASEYDLALPLEVKADRLYLDFPGTASHCYA